ncbi:MAG TPA: organomercurial lyase [Frankiaceae bacterium]|jgi:hypothetical protein|nr:organomercurial lyase [Frankiaceae bacterium]
MPEDVHERVRRAVYDSFARHGRAPRRAEISTVVSASEVEVDASLERLTRNRHLVLDDAEDVVMAHPFSSVNLGFSVMGSKTLWWGGCAWDSFAVPHLVPAEPRVLVATACPSCDSPLAWHVTREEPPVGSEVAHFLVPMAGCWNDVVFTCSNQRIFCSPDCVDAWLSRTKQEAGYVMDPCRRSGAWRRTGTADGCEVPISGETLRRQRTTFARWGCTGRSGVSRTSWSPASKSIRTRLFTARRFGHDSPVNHGDLESAT